MNCQQVAKFHAKRLKRNENIPESFRGGGTFFLKHPVVCCPSENCLPSKLVMSLSSETSSTDGDTEDYGYEDDTEYEYSSDDDEDSGVYMY